MGGGVNMNNIYYAIFSKVLCLSLLSNPTPCEDSLMQIDCGNPEFKNMILQLKLFSIVNVTSKQSSTIFFATITMLTVKYCYKMLLTIIATGC